MIYYDPEPFVADLVDGKVPECDKFKYGRGPLTEGNMIDLATWLRTQRGIVRFTMMDLAEYLDSITYSPEKK